MPHPVEAQRDRTSHLVGFLFIVGFLAWGIGLIALLSFNVLKHWTIAGQTLFTWDIDFPTNIMLPLGGLGYAFFTGWILPKKISREEINSPKLYSTWLFLVRYIAPVAIACIFLSSFFR